MESQERKQHGHAGLSRVLLVPVLGATLLLVYLLARNVASKLPRDDFAGYGDYNFSEWMIDWSEGFVRRGLGGEVIRAIAPCLESLGIAAPVGVAIWQTAVAGLVLFCSLFAYVVVKQRPLPMAVRLGLCASPVGLAFVALNADEILKKDAWAILLCLAMFPFVASCSGAAAKRALLFVQSLLALGAMLLHELAILIGVPAMAYVLAHSLQGLSPAGRRGLLAGYLTILGSGGFAVLASARLSRDAASRMCVESARSLSAMWDCSNLNEYAFGQSTWTPAVAWAETLANLSAQHNSFELPALLVLACIHLSSCSVVVPRADRGRLVVWLLAAAAFALPAFVLAGDWGRFAFMFVSAWTIAILSTRLQSANRDAGRNWRDSQSDASVGGAVLIAGVMLGVISVLVRVNVCCTSDLISVSPIWEALVRMRVK